MKGVERLQKRVDILNVLMYINKRIQNYKSSQSQNDVFTPKDERMTLSCQSFETCGVKKSDQKKYNRYVPEKFEF